MPMRRASRAGSGPCWSRSASVPPRRSSRMRYGPCSLLPTSKSVTTFGWESRAAASASRRSRSWRRSVSSPPPPSTALKATARPSSRSRASQTTPKPPRPISRSSSNRPTTAPACRTRSQPDAPGAWASSAIREVRERGSTACAPSCSGSPKATPAFGPWSGPVVCFATLPRRGDPHRRPFEASHPKEVAPLLGGAQRLEAAPQIAFRGLALG
jgi:hypothetical protein